jgi:hypothetical protein
LNAVVVYLCLFTSLQHSPTENAGVFGISTDLNICMKKLGRPRGSRNKVNATHIRKVRAVFVGDYMNHKQLSERTRWMTRYKLVEDYRVIRAVQRLEPIQAE